MNYLKFLFIGLIGVLVYSCSDSDSEVLCKVNITDEISSFDAANFNMVKGKVVFSEVNTSKDYEFDLPVNEVNLPVGVYNVTATMTMVSDDKEVNFKANQYQFTLSDNSNLKLQWWIFNPENTLVFGEIYFTGTLNAKGTSGIFDTYFTIYNNTDEIQYADGIAIVESKLLNTTTDQILTPANQRDVNFTAQAIYMVPGTGKDVPILPGQSIKIVDQAIDWSEQIPGAFNHTDADFEWYDESTSASVVDTDNPSVPNLIKWFSYSATIWIPSNQCNRSYALVKLPADMTLDRFLIEQKGDYDYVNSATGKQMKGEKCFLIKPEWIIDGVNLCPTEKFTEPVLPPTIDSGYAAISEKNSDVNRFGRKFIRKTSGTSFSGAQMLQDTDNSADDFQVVAAH